MALYFKRGNWGWNPYKKYKYGSRKTKGNMKAAKQTRDAMSVTVKCNTTFMSAYNKTDNYGTAVIPVYEILKKSPQFTSFSALYDQVKVNGIRVKLSIVDAETSVQNLSNLKTVNVITGWDRTGISHEQLKFFSDLGSGSTLPTVINPDKYDETVVKMFTYKIGKGIVNATGISKTTVNATTRWSSSPYLYPSTNEEKSCYLSTSSFKDFVEGVNLGNGYSKLASEYDGLTVHQLTNSSNPCIPFESPICKWKPCLMVGVFRSTIAEDSNHVKYIEQYDDCGQILFNAEFTVDVTFRNIKAASI
jgi:hypothetical protein